RRLWSLPGVQGVPVAELKPVVRQWYEASRRALEGVSFTDVWAEFTTVYEKVQQPHGEDVFHSLWEQSGHMAPPPEADAYEDDDKVRRLITFCWLLQQNKGSMPFPLGCIDAGRLLGVNPKTANRWLRMLVADGVLERVGKGSKVTGLASEYRYLSRQPLA